MTNPLFAGVDVGGTNTKVGLVDDAGQIIAHTSFSTQQEKGPEYALRRANEIIRQLLNDADHLYSDLLGVGLATPGTMDIPRGMILTPFNMSGWRNANVRDQLSDLTNRPVNFSNDATAAAFGENWIGHGQVYSSIVFITLGTGVGGGIIIDDRAIVGKHSHGAEIGHMIVDISDNARTCSCGQRGHLEAYASATAVVNRCQQELESGVASCLTETIDSASPLTAKMIARAAETNDALATRIVNETASYLAKGIVSLAHIIDPDAVLLGGAMNFGGPSSTLGRKFLDRIRNEVRNCSLPIIAETLTIEFATLGGNAGFAGAAGLARRDYHQSASRATA